MSKQIKTRQENDVKTFDFSIALKMTTLLQTEISEVLLDGFSLNSVQPFMVPRG